MDRASFFLLLLVVFSSIKMASAKQKHCSYLVTVYTGDREGAGTDADVFMRLVSQNGVSLNAHLTRPGDTFQRNGVDKFVVKNICVGRICKVELTQNGKNPNPSWYLKGVKVDVKHRQTCISSESFTINQWIKDPKGPRNYRWMPASNCGKPAAPNPVLKCDVILNLPILASRRMRLAELESSLQPSIYGGPEYVQATSCEEMARVSLFLLLLVASWLFSSASLASAGRRGRGHEPWCKYLVTVGTSAGKRQGAGTTAHVYMRLFNQEGVSLNAVLARPGAFQFGAIDYFVVKDKCIGRICKVEFTQNGMNEHSSWHLQNATVAAKFRKQCISKESFKYDLWIDDPEGPRDYHWLIANNCDETPDPNPDC